LKRVSLPFQDNAKIVKRLRVTDLLLGVAAEDFLGADVAAEEECDEEAIVANDFVQGASPSLSFSIPLSFYYDESLHYDGRRLLISAGYTL